MKQGSLRRSLALMGLATSLVFSCKILAQEEIAPAKKQDYVISVEDILEVHVWKEPELSREVMVREDGKISLPLVDDIQAAGRTPVELKKAIAEKLSEFLVDPQVSVIVKSPRKYKVYVTGNVNKPGHYESLTPITPLQAIAMAGGLNEWASSKLIILSHEKGEQVRRVINYKDVISGEALDQNRPLNSGATIIVP